MKKFIFFTIIFLSAVKADAQSNRKVIAKKSAQSKTNTSFTKSGQTTYLKSSSKYNAFSSKTAGVRQLRPGNTKENFLQLQESRTINQFNKSGLIGIPRGTYGFANGKSPHAGFGPYGDRIPPFKDILNSGAGTGNAMDSINTKRQ